MTSPKQLIEAFGLTPKKSLGQNFLHDPNILNRIVESADLPPNATVLEIGPGTGALTQLLAPRAGRLLVIETDQRLQPILEQQLAAFHNIEWYWIDFLKADIGALVGEDEYYVVANLPYYITSAILRQLLDTPYRPHRLVLTVQKEVAQRIIAKPNEMSILSVSVQFYGQPQIIIQLNPAVFWPRPDVDSTVIRIDVYEKPLFEVDEALFFQVVRAGFSQKRKQIKNALSHGLGINALTLLEAANIDSSRRAETLTLEEWATLSKVYANLK